VLATFCWLHLSIIGGHIISRIHVLQNYVDLGKKKEVPVNRLGFRIFSLQP
jgi:hypothetical protein